jgi:hypothetical protein
MMDLQNLNQSEEQESVEQHIQPAILEEEDFRHEVYANVEN